MRRFSQGGRVAERREPQASKRHRLQQHHWRDHHGREVAPIAALVCERREGIRGLPSPAGPPPLLPVFRYSQLSEFGEMVGGYQETGGHPWGPRDTITIRIEDPANPVNAAFNGQEFTAQDEVYQLADHYSRDKLRVLLSINTDKSDFENEKRRFWPARKADKDFPMSFIKPYGKGRVFNTIFGHNPAAFSTPALLKHFLAGIRSAIGDLKADDSPGAGKCGSTDRRTP